MDMNLDASVSTIMTSSVATVTPEDKLVKIKHLYERPEYHSHIPVEQDGKLVGIVSLVNFMRAIHDASLDDNEPVYQSRFVKEIMTPNPSTVNSNSTIREVANLLSEGEFHSVIVTEDDVVKGIVTTTDLVRLMLDK